MLMMHLESFPLREESAGRAEHIRCAFPDNKTKSPHHPQPHPFPFQEDLTLWLVLAGARPYKERAAGPPTEKWSPSFQLHLHEHLHPGVQTGYSPAWHHGALSRRGPALSFAVCPNQRSLIVHDFLP